MLGATGLRANGSDKYQLVLGERGFFLQEIGVLHAMLLAFVLFNVGFVVRAFAAIDFAAFLL